MSQPVTVRLLDPAADELRFIARRERRSVSEIGARFIAEGLRQNRFPCIEFRSFNGERHACVKGALQIWQVIMVAKDFGMDAEKVAAHLALKPEQTQCAFHYYETYPQEIDQALEENDLGFERLKALLPNLRLASAPIETETNEKATPEMLAFLLDKQISHVVMEQLRPKRPDIRIESAQLWQNANLRGKADEMVLAAAREEGLTLVTYDQKTIPPILMELALREEHHSGVLFVDRNTIAANNVGALVKALIAFHDQYHSLPWTDLVMFLAPVPLA